jgi:hypothetical protein
MQSAIAVASQEAKSPSVSIDALQHSNFIVVALWSATGLLATAGLIIFFPFSSDLFALIGSLA